MSPAPRSVHVASLAAAVLLLVMATQAVSTLEFQPIDESTGRSERHGLDEMCRTTAKRLEVVNELFAGRRSVPEAVARFRQLTEECSFDTMSNLRTLYPGHSDDELHYLHVRSFIEANRVRFGVSDEVVEKLYYDVETSRMSLPEFAGQGKANPSID